MELGRRAKEDYATDSSDPNSGSEACSKDSSNCKTGSDKQGLENLDKSSVIICICEREFQEIRASHGSKTRACCTGLVVR